MISEVSHGYGKPSAGKDGPIGHHAQTIHPHNTRSPQEFDLSVVLPHVKRLKWEEVLFVRFCGEEIGQGPYHVSPLLFLKDIAQALSSPTPGDEPFKDQSINAQFLEECEGG